MILPGNIKDRFSGLEFFGVFQFYTVPLPVKIIIINPFYTTLLELRTKDGGLKKQWFYNQDTDNPIEEISIEMTEKGFGACKVLFSDLMFPVDASDVIRLFFGGTAIYEGIVDNDVDISDPELTAAPFWKRYDEVLFTATYGAGTGVKEILEDIIDSKASETGIIWDGANVDIGDSPPVLSVEYADALVKETIDTLVEIAGAPYYWGVDADRKFFVKEYVETGDPTHKFFATDEAEFKKVTIKEDYSKVDMTEAVVYKKAAGGGDTEKVGLVGNYGNVTYPPLEIVKKIRSKVGKLTASEVLLDETALKWAYEFLKKQAQDATTVKVDDIDLNKYNPKIGDRILVEDEFKRSMVISVECDSDTDWTNVSGAAGEGKDEESAVKLFTDGSNNSYYDFGRPIQYYKQEKIGFYFKAPIDTVIDVAFSESLTPSAGEWFKFASPDDGVLSYRDFNYSGEFQYIHFKYVAGDIYVDNIQVFCETKKQIITTVKKIQIKWNSSGISCNISCGNIKNPETEQMNKLSRKIKILEAINNI